MRIVAITIVLAIGLLPRSSMAQGGSQRAALVVDGDHTADADLQLGVRDALGGIGASIFDRETVSAARAFVVSTPDATLNDEALQQLRTRLGAEWVILVETRSIKGGAIALSVSVASDAGVSHDFATTSPGQLVSVIVTQLQARLAVANSAAAATSGRTPAAPSRNGRRASSAIDASTSEEDNEDAPPSRDRAREEARPEPSAEPSATADGPARRWGALYATYGTDNFGYGAGLRLNSEIAKNTVLSVDVGAVFNNQHFDMLGVSGNITTIFAFAVLGVGYEIHLGPSSRLTLRGGVVPLYQAVQYPAEFRGMSGAPFWTTDWTFAFDGGASFMTLHGKYGLLIGVDVFSREGGSIALLHVGLASGFSK